MTAARTPNVAPREPVDSSDSLWSVKLRRSAASPPPGYHGRYLRIDLSTRSAEPIEIPPDILRRYIGGSGLGTWLLLREAPGCVTLEERSDAAGRPSAPPDALAPEMPLVIAFSPLVGTPLTTSAKFAMLAKSPLTERINDSLSSSSFAIAGKNTGFDAIVIRGAAEVPTCLSITPDEVAAVAAAGEWGRSASDAAQILSARLGAQSRIAAIGPAGERLVSFATVSHDGRHAGRGGIGAVMGSKRLKAIAVRGDCRAAVAHPRELADHARSLSEQSFGPATAKYRELGTVSNLLAFNRLGVLPTRNFQTSTFPEAAAIAPETIAEQFPRTRASCAACTIGCEHIFHPDGEAGVRLEYENLFALGPLCGVSDPAAVLKASRLCDELGVDTISAGGAVAFAMECAERGIIDAPDLRFGSAEALLCMLDQIGRREGLGDLLGRGVRAAARRIGNGAEQFAMHVKGLELPGYEPRALRAMALGFAVGTRGADHNRSGAYQVDFSELPQDRDVTAAAVEGAIATENEAALMDALILCKFLRGVFPDRTAAMAHMLELVAGWSIEPGELRETANRIVTAKKWYNVQQGWTPEEDRLPDRFFDHPLPDGAAAGAVLTRDQLQQLIDQYNLARGWSNEGYPPAN